MQTTFDLVNDFGCIPDGVTDNTTNIQNAFDTVLPGGDLYIPPSFMYSSTGQYIGGFAFSAPLVLSRPINLTGSGMYSNLKPMSSFPISQPNIHVRQSGTYWFNTTFSNFSLGNDPTTNAYSRSGGRGIWVDAVSIPFLHFEKLLIGDSGNDYSFVLDGIGTQRCNFDKCRIDGGLHLNGVADSHMLTKCAFGGRSSFGVVVNMPGAGGVQVLSCIITTPGGLVIQSGSLAIIEKTFFEELAGYPTNNTVLVGGPNSQLGLIAYPDRPISSARVRDNIFNMAMSKDGVNIFCNPATKGITDTLIEGNVFNINSNRGHIRNYDPSLRLGPNSYTQALRMFPGSIPAICTYGGG